MQPLDADDVKQMVSGKSIGTVKALEHGERVMETIARHKDGGAVGGFLELIDNGVSAAEERGYGEDRRMKHAEIVASAKVKRDGRTQLNVCSSTRGLNTAKKFDKSVMLGGDFESDVNDGLFNHNHHGSRAALCNFGHMKALDNGRFAPQTAVALVAYYQHGRPHGIVGAIGSCIQANPEKDTVICDSARTNFVKESNPNTGEPEFRYITQQHVDGVADPPAVDLDARNKITGAIMCHGANVPLSDYARMSALEDGVMDVLNPLIPLVKMWDARGCGNEAVMWSICDIGQQDDRAVSTDKSNCKVQVAKAGGADTILLHDARGTGPEFMVDAWSAIGRTYDLRDSGVKILCNQVNVSELQKTPSSAIGNHAHLKILRATPDVHGYTQWFAEKGVRAYTITVWLSPRSDRENPHNYAGTHPGSFCNPYRSRIQLMQAARAKGPAAHEAALREHVDSIASDDLSGGVVYVKVGKTVRMIHSDPTTAADFNLVFPDTDKIMVMNQIVEVSAKSDTPAERKFLLTFALLFFSHADLLYRAKRVILKRLLDDHFKGTLMDPITDAQLDMDATEFLEMVKTNFMNNNVLGWREVRRTSSSSGGKRSGMDHVTHPCPQCGCFVHQKAYECKLDAATSCTGGVPYALAARPFEAAKDERNTKNAHNAWWVTGMYCSAECARKARKVRNEMVEFIRSDPIANAKFTTEGGIDVLYTGECDGKCGAYCVQHPWGMQYLSLIQYAGAHTCHTIEWHDSKVFGNVSNSDKTEFHESFDATRQFNKSVKELRMDLMAMQTSAVLQHHSSVVIAEWIKQQNTLQALMNAKSRLVTANLATMSAALEKHRCGQQHTSRLQIEEQTRRDKAAAETAKTVRQLQAKTEAADAAAAQAKEEKAIALAKLEKRNKDAETNRVRQETMRKDKRTSTGSFFKVAADTFSQKTIEYRALKENASRALTYEAGGEAGGGGAEEGEIVETPGRLDTHLKLFGYKMPKSAAYPTPWLDEEHDTVCEKNTGDHIVIVPTSKEGAAREATDMSRAWSEMLLDKQAKGLMWHNNTPYSIESGLPLQASDERTVGMLEFMDGLLTYNKDFYTKYTARKLVDLYEQSHPCTADGRLCSKVNGLLLIGSAVDKVMEEIDVALERTAKYEHRNAGRRLSEEVVDSDASAEATPTSLKRKRPQKLAKLAAHKGPRASANPVAGAAGPSQTPILIDDDEVLEVANGGAHVVNDIDD